MRIEINGVGIAYEQAGAGEDLVLIPGLGGSRHLWGAQLAGLSRVCRVTAVEPRGHGDSDAEPRPYSIAGWTEEVAGVIEALELAPAVVVGSSMAAMTAATLAARQPRAVRGLVLVGGFPCLAPVGKEALEARAVLTETEGMAPIADVVAPGALSPVTAQTQPALLALLRANVLTNQPRSYAAACRSLVEADVRPLLAQIAAPTLILVGDGDGVAPLPAARTLREAIPDARLRVLPASGHLPFLEQPLAFNRALLEFLGELPPIAE